MAAVHALGVAVEDAPFAPFLNLVAPPDAASREASRRVFARVGRGTAFVAALVREAAGADRARALAAIVGDPVVAASILRLASFLQANHAPSPVETSIAFHLFAGEVARADGAQRATPVARFVARVDELVLRAMPVHVAGFGHSGDAAHDVCHVVFPVSPGRCAKAVRKVVEGITASAKWIADNAERLIRSGLTSLLGKKAGDVVWNIVRMLAGAAASIKDQMVAGFEALFGFVSRILSGDVKGAFTVLLTKLSEGLIGPLVGDIGRLIGMPEKAIKALREKLAKKNPLLPLNLVTLALSGVTANVQAAVTQLIGIIRPVLVDLLIELKVVSERARRAVAVAIDIGTKLVLMVVNNIAKIDDIIDTIKSGLRKLFAGGAGGGSVNVEKLIDDAARAMLRALEKFDVSAFFQQIGKLASAPNIERYAGEVVAAIDSILKKSATEIAAAFKSLYEKASAPNVVAILKSVEELLKKASAVDLRRITDFSLMKLPANMRADVIERAVQRAEPALRKRLEAMLATDTQPLRTGTPGSGSQRAEPQRAESLPPSRPTSESSYPPDAVLASTVPWVPILLAGGAAALLFGTLAVRKPSGARA